jgi:hypothetical protein
MIDRFNACFPHLSGEAAAEIEDVIDRLSEEVRHLSSLEKGRSGYEVHHCTRIGRDLHTLMVVLIPQLIFCLKIEGLTEHQAQLIQQEITRRFFSSELAATIKRTLLHPIPDYSEAQS